MKESFAEMVYYTLCGELIESAQVPGVENAYEEGGDCDRWYSEMLEAYAHLRDRLQVVDEDEDVEKMIFYFMNIQQHLCLKMFEYGARFANRQ